MPAARPLHYLLIGALGALLFFTNLGGASLWDVDEGRNATAALEMYERGNFIVPTFNSELRVDKPALLYWLQMAAYELFGVNEFAARFPSALAALFTLLIGYELGRALFGPLTGFWGACLLGTTPMLCGAGRFANPDALLNAFTALTLTLFWIGQSWPRTLWFLALGAATGFAVLAKGPVGLVLPGGVIFLFLLWDRRLGILWDRRLGWGVLAFLVVAAPWYIWVAVDTKSNFIKGFLLQHNVGRFLSPMETHAGFPGFYLIVLLLGTLPWSIFFGATFWYAGWSLRRAVGPRWQETWQRAVDRSDATTDPASRYRFLITWLALYLVFFTIAATKLPNYVLPVVVPFCILSARFLERWRRGEIEPARRWVHASLLSLALLGIGMAAGFLIAGGALAVPGVERIYPAVAPWAALGVAPVVAACCGWYLLRNGSGVGRTRWIACLVLCAVAFWTPLAAWANAAFNAYKAPRPLVAELGGSRRHQEFLIGGLRMEHLSSLHFYVQRNIIHHLNDDEAQAFLRYPMPVYLFLPGRIWDEWQKAGVPARLVSRHPDLYRRDDVVVLTNR